MSTLYEKVKGALRERIANGEYRPGQKIPSEAELVREFAVSAITVRRAIRDLAVEGRVIGRQGLGVFVADRPRIARSLDADYLASLGDAIRKAGFTPGMRELSLTLAAPEPAVAEALRLSPGEVVYRHEKAVLADGQPICFDVAYIRQDLARLIRDDLASEFLLPLIARHGIRCSAVEYRIEAASASAREAAVLGLPVGAPLLGVRYLPASPRRNPLFVGHMLACPERLTFAIRVPSRRGARRKAPIGGR
jgi:DNA-binding GntR family transcriptional regulator